MNRKIKELIEFIIRNSVRESIFLTPSPSYNVNSTLLMDKVCLIWKLDKKEVSQFVDKIADEIDG